MKLDEMRESISIVVPSLNSAKTIAMTLLSLRAQAGCSPRIIVADSGSEDGTLEICKKFDVKTIYVAPGNMYAAINEGLRQCDSEWLGYLNSDDVLYPKSLYKLFCLGKSSNASIVYGACDYIDEEGRFLYSMRPAKPMILLPMFRVGVWGFAQQAVIYRRKVYEGISGFNEIYKYCADVDFFWRALEAEFRFASLRASTVACFRLHRGQISQKNAKDMEIEKRLIITQHRARPNIHDHFAFLKWRLQNGIQYLIRIMRRYELQRKITLPRSLDSPD